MEKKNEISQRVKQLITSNFTTISQIEVLCFLRRAKLEYFSIEKINNLLSLSEIFVTQILGMLHDKNFLIKEDDLYKFNVECVSEKDGTLEALNDILIKRKSHIIEILFNSFLKDGK